MYLIYYVKHVLLWVLYKFIISRGHKMIDSKISSMEIKKINLSKVYAMIYSEKITSKQNIANTLQLSMPTVTQNIKELEQLHMIEKNGLYESTGGRKAHMIVCIKNARIAIGIEILKDIVYVAAVDLYGTPFKEDVLHLSYQNSEKYYKALGEQVNSFIASLPFSKKRILGVGIALQGLISIDGESVTYGKILKCTGAKRGDFAKYIDWPCILIHDSEAAAFAELWNQKNIDDSVYLSLNNNFGGAVILNKKIYRGKNLRSGTLEHVCLIPNGRPCYCGKKGCLEAYCSANALLEDTGEDFNLFFNKIRKGDQKSKDIWFNYLNQLSIAICNIHNVLDTDIILGGLLIPYITEEDITLLAKLVQDHYAFPLDDFKISLGRCGHKATKIGAALCYIQPFLKQI